MTRTVALVLLAAPGLAACRVDGDADAQSIRDLLDAGLSSPAEPPAPGRPLDLPTALRLANARSEALAESGEVWVRAVIDRRRAAAAFLPTISLVPSLFARENTSSHDRNRGFDLSAEGTLDVAPAVDVPEERRAELAAERERARLFAVQDDLLLDTARTLLAVRLAERSAAVLRASLEIQQARVEDARGRVEAGVVRPLDVALAESRAADVRVGIVIAEREARNARAALSYLTAWDVGDTPVDDTLAMPEEPRSEAELVAEAERRRPELAAADADVDAARAALRSACGQWWPSVEIDLDAFLVRDSQPDELDWSAFLDVTIPVFRAGLIEADVRTALSRLREATLARARTVREIRLDLRVARESYAAERRRLEELGVRLEAARRAREDADGLWAAGLATNLERLTAQDELLAVELEVVRAEQDRRARELDILRGAGSLHETAGLRRPGLRRPPEEGRDAEAR